MGIKRIFKRSWEEICASFKIAKITSLSKAISVFIAKIDVQVLSRSKKGENKKQKKRLIKKHEIMMEYFNITMKDYVEKYIINKNIPGENKSNVIWMCWWQGYDNAPLIVKRCIDSVKRNCGEKEVILITEDNYKDYVSIPDWVEEKKRKGIISKTHFSDILRLSLLSMYGGMWLDATFYCTSNIEKYFNYPIWSIKRPDYLHCSIASGYFANYSLSCKFDKRWIFKVILDLYLYYWKTNKKQIDYLTTDYMIVMAQHMDFEIKNLFSNIEPNNPNCDELSKHLNDQYSPDKWNELKKDTELFKLSWKHKTKKKNNTFYSILIEKR